MRSQSSAVAVGEMSNTSRMPCAGDAITLRSERCTPASCISTSSSSSRVRSMRVTSSIASTGVACASCRTTARAASA
ncbi:hypothetical protein BC477_13240 [Clavibacter michiganensis subsp. michiganensis]|uniref:Uncharacterized protein n=1 Tax=Clavibacter michiganensis subsp. michiganensis TaxID=33013 RepID=A0A251XI89_CLAMM|nr:hypothetical protein BC477_13240 [Clavibacter michiganensis subsp. michiganensis]OUE02760.1 hypothetical protein CMMCAS07_12145 [Clavibacter michiganensis subsp. michiganensis]